MSASVNTQIKPIIVKPGSKWVSLNLRDLWAYRELLGFLVWRDIKVRYKQTVLGVAWAVLQPFFAMIIFSVFFGRFAKIPSDGIPYPLFVYCALLPWQLFSFALTESTNSIVSNRQLITKVYFPRLIIPLTSVFTGLVDFCVSFLVLIGMLFYYGRTLSLHVFFFPFFILMAIATALAAGLWLSALNVKYRDIRYTIPFLIQFWLYATPIAYPSSLVPEKWRALYGLNPMAGVVEGFRWSLLGTGNSHSSLLLISVSATVVCLIGGMYYFRRTEKYFADLA